MLTSEEQLMLELINRARANPEAEAARFGIDLNEGLAAGSIDAGAKQPLAADDLLQNAAEAHSDWMLATDTFSHEGAGGSSVSDRVSDAGYAWTIAGENISWKGTTSPLTDLAGFIAAQHESLFLSAGHRQNLLNDSFSEVGIAQETGGFDGYNTSMVTQDFADDNGPALLVGVVIDDRDDDDFYDVGEGLGGVTVTATAGGRTFTGETYAAGGYSLEVPAGTYEVVFAGFEAGGEFATTVTVGSKNVKVDVELDDLPQPVASGGATTGDATTAGDPSHLGYMPSSGRDGLMAPAASIGGYAGYGGRDGSPGDAGMAMQQPGIFGQSDSLFGRALPGGDGDGGFQQLYGSREMPGDDRFDFTNLGGAGRGDLPEGSVPQYLSGRDSQDHLPQQFGQVTGRDDAPDLGGEDMLFADSLVLQSWGDWA